MTATVKEFCRINGLSEETEDLVELIFTALTGEKNEYTRRSTDAREKIKAAISYGAAGEADP